MRLVIAAGGTGGHLFPALALALALKEAGARPLAAGHITPQLRREFEAAGIPWVDLPAVRLPRRKAGYLWLPFRLIWAWLAAAFLLARRRPAAVIGMGGYASAAPAAAARCLGIRLYFCEQNLLPGKVTRFFSRWSEAVFTAFPESSGYLQSKRVLNFGNPLRPSLKPVDRKAARRELGLDEGRFTLLVLGGSQGAHRINLKVLEALPGLNREQVQFIHLTGPADHPAVEAAYRTGGWSAFTAPFQSAMEVPYSAADLVLCRAGATTIAELIRFGKPALLIPLPSAAEDHQRLNARWLAERKAARVIEEGDLTGKNLAEEVSGLAGAPDRLAAMAAAAGGLARPDPARSIGAYLLGELGGKSTSEKTSA